MLSGPVAMPATTTTGADRPRGRLRLTRSAAPTPCREDGRFAAWALHEFADPLTCHPSSSPSRHFSATQNRFRGIFQPYEVGAWSTSTERISARRDSQAIPILPAHVYGAFEARRYVTARVRAPT